MRKLLVFDVSGRLCALPVEAISEIVHITATVTAPGQPSSLEGFLNFHGRLIPVIVLARLFALPEQELGLYAVTILVRESGQSIGILVNSVEGIVSVPGTGVRPLPSEHSLNDCAEAQFTSEGRTVTLLAPERILLDKERRFIADLADQAQSRLGEIDESRSGTP
jgi:purine-binding chemotaxis protein CheW